MKQGNISILVIDRQAYWRECVAETLRSAGYLVSTLAIYDEVLEGQVGEKEHNFALVLLGCANIEREERLLITHLLARKQYVIVFAVLLPSQVMRAIFVRGAEDAVDKVYDSMEILAIVEQALERIDSRKRTHFPIERGKIS
jgi:DNA-binding NtrC family response regulator